MQQYIILLRGINVGGIKILMKDLKSLLDKLGFSAVQTYIQTGNIILYAKEKNALKIEQKINAAILSTFNYDIDVFAIDNNVLEQAIAMNPFQNEKGINQDKVYFALTKGSPDANNWDALKKISFENESFHYIEPFLFWYSHLSFSESKLNNNYFENKLKIRATTRNMKTIKKLIEKAK